MTPVELLILVGIIVLARVILSVPAIVQRSPRAQHVAHEFLDPFIIAGIAAWFLISFVARTYYIPSGSMVQTLACGDVLLVDKFEYRFHAPHEGDIVVFPPPLPSQDDFIKRVIGLPGDTLRISGGVVYRNGVALAEPYIAHTASYVPEMAACSGGQPVMAPPARPTYDLAVRNYGIYVNLHDGGGWEPLDPSQANIPPRSMWIAPNRIPPHCFIMLGDNRNDSEDSHVWGFAQDAGRFASGPRKGQTAGFTGRAFLIFWPPSQVRILHG
ncbi:MAG: signal peptidase I [Candidatus Tyrphobacter sp.]